MTRDAALRIIQRLAIRGLTNGNQQAVLVEILELADDTIQQHKDVDLEENRYSTRDDMPMEERL